MNNHAIVSVMFVGIAALVSPCSRAADAASCSAPIGAMSTDKAELEFPKVVACLGDSSKGDQDAMTKQIEKLLSDLMNPATNDIAPVVKTIRQKFAERTANVSLDASLATTHKRIDQLRTRLDTLASLLLFGDGFAADLDDNNYWRFDNQGTGDNFSFMSSPSDRPDVEDFYLSDLYYQACSGVSAGDSCASAVAVSVETIRVVNLTGRSLAVLDQKILDQLRKGSLLRRNEWKAYFGEALVQYPWEIAVNGLIYGQANKETRTQLLDPPDWQLILLHPDAALEYVGGVADGDAFKPAVVLEVVGANFWGWDKTSGSTQNAYGASVGVLYADRAKVTDAGVALTFHILQKYSIGASVHSGKWGLFFNIPLADKLRKTYDDGKKAFTSLQ